MSKKTAYLASAGVVIFASILISSLSGPEKSNSLVKKNCNNAKNRRRAEP